MITQERLKLYVDPKWRRREVHSPLMNPWWGNPFEEQSVFPKQMYDTYSFDTSFYLVTENIKEAEMVFAPYRHSWLVRSDRALLDECLRKAKDNDLPLLVDGASDIEYQVEGERIVVLRYGGYRFIPEEGRVQVPLNTDDLLARCRDGRLQIRAKKEGKPSVGFAGWAKLSVRQYLRTMAKESLVRLRGIIDSRYRACTKGVLWRKKALNILNRSPLVDLNLRARGTFSATPKTAEGDVMRLREEMVETILSSDYALDVRGDANNSARLFEILSLGRIPVIVDTERRFPFMDKIDYSSFAVVVDFRDIKKLPEIIADFHRKVSPARFEEMQRNAREIYLKYFRIDAQMGYIVEEVRKRIKDVCQV